jgi:TatD DNase family protein
MLVDTHAHLTDERLAADVPGVVARAREAGVAWIVTIASDLADSERTVDLARSVEGVSATVGIHPHAASSATPDAFERLAVLAREPGVVALGEAGLDYHYDNSPREVQRAVFARQLGLARELELPLVVHAREADGDVRAAMRDSVWELGVLHCFSSGRVLLEEALALGWYVSFGGMITFPKWDAADLLRMVPLDRLLLETDSPYLAPVPHRGRRNEPAYVGLVARRAAELRNEDVEALIEATGENARRFYGLPERAAARPAV